MRVADLVTGTAYVTEDGTRVVVVDPTPVPDGQPNQRKVLVHIDGEDAYVLPRQIQHVAPPARRVASKKPLITPRRSYVDLDDPRVDVFRPDPRVVESYVSRRMPNGQRDVDYLLDCWRRRENVLLVGDTQAGKSMLVQVLAVLGGNLMGMGKPLPVFRLSASNGITDYDLFGQPAPYTDEDGAEHLVHLQGIVELAAKVGGILELDEVSMMPERVTSALHPVTDWRRDFVNTKRAVPVPGDGFMPEHVKVSDDLWIVASMNPNYRGSGRLNEAFANRFRHITWDYDDEVERALIHNEGVLALGEALRTARAVSSITTPVGTSALIRLSDDIERDGVDMALFCLLSMFGVEERPFVNEIIDSKSFRSLLARKAATFMVDDEEEADDSEQPF